MYVAVSVYVCVYDKSLCHFIVCVHLVYKNCVYAVTASKSNSQPSYNTSPRTWMSHTRKQPLMQTSKASLDFP